MFGNVQTINTGGFGGFYKFQPLVKQSRQRPVAMLDMIKQSDLHNAFRSLSIPYKPGLQLSGICSASRAENHQLSFGGNPTRRPMPMQSASVFNPAAWMPWTASSSSRSSVSPVTPTAPMTSPSESRISMPPPSGKI